MIHFRNYFFFTSTQKLNQFFLAYKLLLKWPGQNDVLVLKNAKYISFIYVLSVSYTRVGWKVHMMTYQLLMTFLTNPSTATVMEKVCGWAGGLCWNINLIWSHSIMFSLWTLQPTPVYTIYVHVPCTTAWTLMVQVNWIHLWSLPYQRRMDNRLICKNNLKGVWSTFAIDIFIYRCR